MATFTQNIDRCFPNISEDEDPRESVKKLNDYVFQLTKQLKYILANLDSDNMTDDAIIEIVKSGSEEIKEELKDIIEADTVISNTVITNELYSQYGNIADLTVWKLRTDYERAKRYLNGDTSDLNYIYIFKETISFITAVTDGTEEIQLSNEEGKLFYWSDESCEQMQFKKTAYPVMVYVYTEYNKGQIYFSYTEGVDTALPVFTLGTGDSMGNGKVVFKKDGDYGYIKLTSRLDGLERGLRIGDEKVEYCQDGVNWLEVGSGGSGSGIITQSHLPTESEVLGYENGAVVAIYDVDEPYIPS